MSHKEYNHELWKKYTKEEEGDLNPKLFDFIYHMTLGLDAKKICEAGCNIGNNLSMFKEGIEVHGFDKNEYAIKNAKEKRPKFNFKVADITDTSFPDSFFDLVFTRGVFIHIPTEKVNESMDELFRISKKWIFNLEYFGDDKTVKWKRGENLLWQRNMAKRWKEYDVEIISDIEIPIKIDKAKTRFTLVRKKSQRHN